jgi:hypothetical protein
MGAAFFYLLVIGYCSFNVTGIIDFADIIICVIINA